MLVVIVALTVAALLGHIGDLSGLSPAQSAGPHDRSMPADPHGAGGSHVASCEATRANTPTCPQTSVSSASIATVAVIDSTMPDRRVLPEPGVASRRAPDRSLFLLHASLLI